MYPPASVVFSGYYGMKNFGDDVFAAVCIQGARVHWNVRKAAYLSPPIKGVPGVSVVRDGRYAEMFSSPGLTGRIARGHALVKALSATEMVVLGGGSVLSSGSFGTRDILAFASTVRGTRLAAIGVSIGPFTSTGTERSVKRFLRRCEYVSVRDAFSYETALELGLSPKVVIGFGLDLAGNFPLLFKVDSEPRSACGPIGLSLCRYESLVGGDQRDEEARIGAMIEVTKALAIDEGRVVNVFSLNGHNSLGDRQLAERARAELASADLTVNVFQYPDVGTAGVWRAIRSCSLMLTIRLHGAIAAYLEGVPFVLSEYHQKCSDFLADVGQPSGLLVGSCASRAELLSAAREAFEEGGEPSMPPKEYMRKASAAFLDAPWM
jgi:polysaccharide pyruvyl transferase WcaK-like protein